MKKNKVVVRLMGHDYALLTDQPTEHVQRMARYVDRKMREVAILSRATDSVAPILTTMTLADELFRAQDENTRLKKELAALTQDGRKNQE
ncbi:MAG: cell division protein ZapA [Clostridia bacterium]|nr:cell division protein ZapA [Clostridia bacterium]